MITRQFIIKNLSIFCPIASSVSFKPSLGTGISKYHTNQFLASPEGAKTIFI
jgi:hypothetical protein